MSGLDSILSSVQTQQSVEEERVLVTFDTHVSDKRSDRHVDYWADCMDMCEWVLKTVRERKVHKVIFPGDLIGRMKDKNLTTREGLLYFVVFLQELNKETNGNVYIVEGNHDQSESLTDYQMFITMGLIKNIPYVDSKITRIQLINYGDEFREVELKEGGNNVAVMHYELHVDGATTWFFPSKKSLTISELKNIKGIKRIYCGHIHTPSPKPVEYSIEGDNGIIHYMGCPTKPSYNRNDYTHVYPVLITSTDTSVKEEIIPYELKKDVWKKSVNAVAEEDENIPELESKDYNEEAFDVKKLGEVLEQLQEYNLLGATDYKQQIEAIGVMDKDLVDFTMSYIQKAEDIFMEKE